MGTSTSYSGPTGSSPLLPPWADDGDDISSVPPSNLPSADGPDGESSRISPTMPEINWQVPKAALTRLARLIGEGASAVSLSAGIGTVGRSYVKASGGAQAAALSARAGRAATANLGGFLADGMNRGFAQAAADIGIQDYVGRDADFVLADFIDALAPEGALREEAAARSAMIDTCIELLTVTILPPEASNLSPRWVRMEFAT